VSDLADRIAEFAFGSPPVPPTRWLQQAAVVKCISTLDVVEFLADEFAVDEQDVLEALAELQHAGWMHEHGRCGEWSCR
jgi:hypothetical protein